MNENNFYPELIFDIIPSGLFCVDMNGNITKWNKRAAEITGYTQEEVLGKSVCVFMEDIGTEKCNSNEKSVPTSIIAKEYTIRKKDGSLRYIVKNAEILHDKNNVIVGSIEIFEDITDRKNDEIRIKELAADWENTFNTFSDLISIQDIDNNLIRVNKAFAEAFNIEVDKVNGEKCYSIVHGTAGCVKGCPHKKSIQSKRIEQFEHYDQNLGKFIEVTTCPLLDENQEVYRIVHIIKDVSARKKAEQLKDDLVSTVSHELRTPLTTIREAVSQVLDGLLGDTTAEQRDFLSMCLEDVDRLMRIINDLLDMSKIDARRVDLNKETLDMVELVKHVQNSFVPRFIEKHLEGKISFSHDPIEVYADRDKLIQVLTNLVGNALKFTTQGSIELKVVDKGNEIECSVIDSGKGIAAEDLPKVFDKFKQVGREYGPGEKGTGLGLAIAQGIIDLHKGRIWAESKKNEGTKFIFTLPKQTAVEARVIESLDRLLKFAKKEQKEFTILLISFHNFKTIEDLYGQDKMDMILNEVFLQFKLVIGIAQPIIMKNQRQIVLLSEVGIQDVTFWKDKVKRIIKGALLKFQEQKDITFSCGYAVYPHDSDTAINLFEQAQNNLIDVQKEQFQKKILLVDDDHAVVQFLKDALKGFGYLNVHSVSDGQAALMVIEKDIPDMIILDMLMPIMNGYEVIGHLKEDIRTKDVPIMIMSGQPVAFDKLSDYICKKAIPVIGKPLDLEQLKKLLWLLA